MKTIKYYLAFLFLSTLTACGYNEGVRSVEQSSFVYFTGNAQGAFATVGEGEPFIIEKLGERNVYKVASGKQRVVVRKSGVIVVDRIVLLSDGQAKEFNISQ